MKCRWCDGDGAYMRATASGGWERVKCPRCKGTKIDPSNANEKKEAPSTH